MKFVDLTLRYDDAVRHPMHEYLGGEGADVSRLLAWNHAEDGVLYALFHVVADRAPYVDALEAVPSIEAFDVTPVDDRSFYVFVRDRTRPADRRFFAAFRHPSLMAVPPLEFRGDGVLRFSLVGEAAALQTVLEELPDAVSARVDEVGEFDRPTRVGPSLTARQREALRAGVDAGFFDVPRTGGVDDVAADLGCAASTASNHLRKAQARLVRHYVDRLTRPGALGASERL